MSIYGPAKNLYETKSQTSQDIDLSAYAKKSNVLTKSGGKINGKLNMNTNKIINLADPTVGTDATTKRYTDNYASHLNNIKLNKAGDFMTGNLLMGFNKITELDDPTEGGDAVNKKYVDKLIKHEHDIRVYALGRYIVIPDQDGTKTYFSVRARKNINLSNELLVEIKK